MRYAVDFYLREDKIMTAVLRVDPEESRALFVYHEAVSAMQDRQRERESFRDYIFQIFETTVLDRVEHNGPYTVYFEKTCDAERRARWFSSLRRLRTNGYVEVRLQDSEVFKGKL